MTIDFFPPHTQWSSDNCPNLAKEKSHQKQQNNNKKITNKKISQRKQKSEFEQNVETN